MTDMKRITISLTDELDKAIETLKQSDEFKGDPASAIIRKLIERGLKVEEVSK